MISKTALFGLILVFGFAAGQLIEVDDSDLSNDHRKGSGNDNASPFGQSDYGPEESSVEITGPKHPEDAGDMLGNDFETNPNQGFNNPNKFPAPEDATQVPKSPGSHFPDPEPENPINGHIGQNNGGFAEVAPSETATQGHEVPSNGGFEPQYPTQKPTHGTFEPYPTERPTHGTFEPYPTQRPTHGTFEPYPTQRPTHGTFEPYPTQRPTNGHNNNGGFTKPHYTEKPHYTQQTTTQKYDHHQTYFPDVSGILGWTKQPNEGGIVDKIKDKVHETIEQKKQALEDLKGAGEKIFEGTKDAAEAIGGIFNPFKPKNKDKGSKHSSLFPFMGFLSRSVSIENISDKVAEEN